MGDIRDGVRALLRTPALTTIAVVVLALGTGATAAIFSVVNGVLLRPLPFADPDRLVQFEPMGVVDFGETRQRARSFDSMVAFQAVNKTLQQGAGPERVSAIAAERGLFDVLGARARLGRTFVPGDPVNVVVVSEGFWRRRFGGVPSVDGWTISLDGEPYSVIGIMPEAFEFPYRSAPAELWLPMDLPATASRFQRVDVAVGRIKRDVTIAAARAELTTIAGQLEAAYPDTNKGRTITIAALDDAVVGRSRPALLTLFGAVLMVFLIACANIANLLLARAETRRHDVAVRMAMGARPWRLFRQLLVESLVLALGAGLVAALVAQRGTTLVVALAGSRIPRAAEIGLDWTAFLFLLGLSVTAGITFGVVPALNAVRVNVTEALNERGARGSRSTGATRIMRGLVIVEIALAFVLLIGAGLLFRAFLHLQAVPTGLTVDNVLTVRLDSRGLLPPERPGASPGESTAQGRYFAAIEQRVSAIPGVRAAGFVTLLPIQSPGNRGSFTVEGRPSPPDGAPSLARLRQVSSSYFRAAGIPLRAGRLLSGRDSEAVVNEALVRRYFAGEDPIGRVLDRGTIVGVVGDVRQSVTDPAEPEIYTTLARTTYSAATLVVSADLRADALAGAVRTAVNQVNPKQATYNIATMAEVVRRSHPELDLYFQCIGFFAIVALVLSVAGMYGVMSHATALRRREFGIRVAVGADASRLLWLVLRQGLVLVGVGLALGMAAALAMTRLLRTQLHGVGPTDPATFVGVALLLTVVALAACLNPARRSMTLDPSIILRDD